MSVSSSHFAEEVWRKGGQDQQFLQVCVTIRDSLSAFVQKLQVGESVVGGFNSECFTQLQDSSCSNSQDSPSVQRADWRHHDTSTTHELEHQETDQVSALPEPFSDLPLEDFWTFLGADSSLTEFSFDLTTMLSTNN